MANVNVTFAVATGGGSITGGASDHQHQRHRDRGKLTWAIRPAPTLSPRRRAGLTGSPATFTATGTAGAAHHLTSSRLQPVRDGAEVASPSATAGASVARPVPANIVNQSNRPVTATIASGGGTLGGTATVQTNASGVVTFSGLSIADLVGPTPSASQQVFSPGPRLERITLQCRSAATIAKSAGDAQKCGGGKHPAGRIQRCWSPTGQVTRWRALARGLRGGHRRRELTTGRQCYQLT